MPPGHHQAGGVRADAVEQGGSVPVIHTCPPAAASRSNRAARRERIEVGGDLVEQQQRAAADAFRDEIGMGEDQPEQQRLLLAGGAAIGRLALVEMGDGEVAAVRAGERAAGGGIAARAPARSSAASAARASPAAGCQPASDRPARANGPAG